MSTKKKPTLLHYKAHVSNIIQQATGIPGWDVNKIPKTTKPVDTSFHQIKLIAFYLPQFHPIPENDEWWGTGFTEWANVSKATPQFLGHHQPHIPGELGFYDLRNPDSIRAQAKLAKHYGIHGFCFHYYWFNGKKLLETPLNLLLGNKDIDINFCLCWANENWTRKWDGLDNEQLISQSYSPEDDIAFLDALVPAFNDPRYIKVDGKPLLVIYRASLLPDAKKTARRWRKRSKEHGFKGIHLVAATSFDIKGADEFGFDASVSFPPHQLKPKIITNEMVIMNSNYTGTIYDYKESVKSARELTFASKVHYHTVMPSWDNEARRPGNGFSFTNGGALAYADWLHWACNRALQNTKKHRFVFVNAWNEWAEGAHLEPDRKHGFAYLHATANVLSQFTYTTPVEKLAAKLQSKFQKSSDLCIAIHLYYHELSDQLIQLISKISSCDVHITISKDTPEKVINKWMHSGLNVFFAITENRGRDIRPFITTYLDFIEPKKYRYFCKIHTKKSLHRPDGDQWREKIYSELFNSDFAISTLKTNKRVGIVVPSEAITDLSVKAIHAGNVTWLDCLLQKIGRNDLIGEYKADFPAGAMFWGKTDALKKLKKLRSFREEFEPEVGQLDGTLAHAFERLFGLLVTEQGYGIAHVSSVASPPASP